MAAGTRRLSPPQRGREPATRAGADLESFLLARVAEDLGTASSHQGQASQCTDHDLGGARRVLLECDAKRRIVDDHRHQSTTTSDGRSSYMDCDVCVEAGGYAKQGGWCLTLRALALPYCEHPEYNQQWRP